MCKVSDKIKFCTCSAEDLQVEDLDHYWILYRYHKGRTSMTLGEPSLPTEFKDPEFSINRDTLLQRVNEHDAFDKPVDLKRKDKLELVLNSKGDYDKVLFYVFEYTGRKWKYVEHDPFELMDHYYEMDSGELDEVY